MSELANAEKAADTKAPVIKRHRDLGPPNPISKRTRGAQLREAVDHTPKPSSSSQSTDHTPRTYVNYNPCMMKHLRASEERSRASPAFLAKQRDINEKMRSILVDWLVDVHLGFHLLSETLFLKGWQSGVWFDNVEKAMLLLSKREYASKARYGYVRGEEPVKYLRNIRKRYRAYQEVTEL